MYTALTVLFMVKILNKDKLEASRCFKELSHRRKYQNSLLGKQRLVAVIKIHHFLGLHQS